MGYLTDASNNNKIWGYFLVMDFGAKLFSTGLQVPCFSGADGSVAAQPALFWGGDKKGDISLR